MLNIKLNGHYLEMYDSIDELPFWRFQEYNRAVMIDSGLGSDIAAIDRHINMARRYNAAGEKEHAEQALLNLRQAIAFVLDRESPEARAFVVLIHRMDGNEVTDLSEGNVKRIIIELSRRGLTAGKLRGFLAHVKKNWTPNWKRFFPASWTARKQRSTTPG